MNQCELCSAGRKAMDALKAAHDYEQRRFMRDGFVSYNPEIAARLWCVAFDLSDKAPDNHCHGVWYFYGERDPNAIYQIKEHMSDRASEESISKSMPLELWADHIEWWK